jgi:hypothetical protein
MVLSNSLFACMSQHCLSLQVAPSEDNSLVWPFVVLLGGLFVPDLVASAVACWAWVCHSRPSSGRPMRLLLATAWLLPFTVWLHFNIIQRVASKVVHVCPSRAAARLQESTAAQPQKSTAVLPQESTVVLPEESTAVLPQESTVVLPQESAAMLPQESTAVQPQESTAVLPQESKAVLPTLPHESAAAALSQVVDPVKYAALLSAVMACTEDPISMGMTSVFYVANKQRLGQVLSTPTYCVSMLLSCVHVLKEAWEHFPALRQGVGAHLAGVCSLQPGDRGAAGEGDMHARRVPRQGSELV